MLSFKGFLPSLIKLFAFVGLWKTLLKGLKAIAYIFYIGSRFGNFFKQNDVRKSNTNFFWRESLQEMQSTEGFFVHNFEFKGKLGSVSIWILIFHSFGLVYWEIFIKFPLYEGPSCSSKLPISRQTSVFMTQFKIFFQPTKTSKYFLSWNFLSWIWKYFKYFTNFKKLLYHSEEIFFKYWFCYTIQIFLIWNSHSLKNFSIKKVCHQKVSS